MKTLSVGWEVTTTLEFHCSFYVLCKNIESFQFSLSDLTSCLVSVSWFVVESQQDWSVIWKQFYYNLIFWFFLWKPTSFNTVWESGFTITFDKIFDRNRNCQSLLDGSQWLTRPDQWPDLCSVSAWLSQGAVTSKRYWMLLLPPTLTVCKILIITSL